MIDFYYSRGIVKTTIPWIRPTTERVSNYFLYLRNKSTILDRYDVYIHGRFMYDRENTWDLDIQLIGNYQLKQLEQDLNYMLDVALNKFRLLVDVRWLQQLLEPITYENTVDINYIPKIVPSIHITNTTSIVKDITKTSTSHNIMEKLNKNMVMVGYGKQKFKLTNLNWSYLDKVKLIMHVDEFLSPTTCAYVTPAGRSVAYYRNR